MTATQGRAAAGNGAGEGPAAGNGAGEGPMTGPGERPVTGAEPAAGGPGTTGDRPRSGDGRGNGGRTGSGDPVRRARPSEQSESAQPSEPVEPVQPSGPVEPVRNDTVAAVVRQWQTVRPDLDTGPMEIIGRVNRCAALLQQAEDAPLRRAGLSRAEFDLLGALRRTGHELTPGELARETFSSGAAVTKRLKQLTERALVERRVDSRDRRVAHLRLTDAGRDLVDGIMPEQLVYESAVLSALDDGRQGELADLLGELLSRLEGHMRALRV
ncbi:transcriptional regulator, MarR family [Actinobacteria bacterium OV320]|nr:transcriptional regulator, MarR family [Actinobacteria bacterium OV320]